MLAAEDAAALLVLPAVQAQTLPRRHDAVALEAVFETVDPRLAADQSSSTPGVLD